jgi:hypothetical protein
MSVPVGVKVVATEIEIDHFTLGYGAWEWDDKEQAQFLAGMAHEFKNAPNAGGVFQIHYIAEQLKGSANEEAVCWLISYLNDYLNGDK